MSGLTLRKRLRHCHRLLVFLLSGVALTGAAAKLAYVDLDGGRACCLVPDGIGNLYVVGSIVSASGTHISVTKLDGASHVVSRFTFGVGNADQPKAAALDPQGNLVIAGQTHSSEFPLVNALISRTEPNAPAGFIAKVNPSNGQILFSTRIGGLGVGSFVRIGSTVNALAVDPAGNIYAGGMTNAKDFPVSGDAFQKSGAGGDSFGPRPYGFVLKLSAAGDRLLYSTLLGGAAANCSGGSHCIGKYASSVVHAITVDRNGIATVGGATNARDFPVTGGVVQTVCRCQEYASNGFVTQFNAGGSGLRWSTFLGGSWYGDAQFPSGTNEVSALAQDTDGNIVAAGRTDADDFPASAGVLQTKFAGESTYNPRPADGFLSKLNAAGTAFLFSTYLGGSGNDRINDLQLDTQGSVWVTGVTDSTDFPGNPATFTGSFYAQVRADGTRLLMSQRTPAGATGQAIRTVDPIVVLGASGSVLRTPSGQIQGVSVFGVASAFGGPVTAYVAPGEIVSLFGTQLGPNPGIGAALDNEGRIANQLAGVQVLFNGIPAPLLYASEGQVNALVPYRINSGERVTVQVNTADGKSSDFAVYPRPARPAVLTSGIAAVALNQDNSVNSQQNPAAPDSIVTIFASGAGLLYNQPADGSIPTVPASTPILPVAVLLNNRSIEVLYAGNAPSLVVNVLQINLRLPQRAAGGLLQLMVGGYISEPFLLFVQ